MAPAQTTKSLERSLETQLKFIDTFSDLLAEPQGMRRTYGSLRVVYELARDKDVDGAEAVRVTVGVAARPLSYGMVYRPLAFGYSSVPELAREVAAYFQRKQIGVAGSTN